MIGRMPCGSCRTVGTAHTEAAAGCAGVEGWSRFTAVVPVKIVFPYPSLPSSPLRKVSHREGLATRPS